MARLASGIAAVALVMGAAQRPDDPTFAAGLPIVEPIATFSIVAYDPATGDLGVAVESKFFGVGRVVPFAAAGVGAIATQARANTTYGARGLELLGRGLAPAETLERLLADDALRGERQVGIIDAEGDAATYTGDACLAWAGGRTGPNYAVQGNILAGAGVVEAMATTFESADGDLAGRMVAALAAGQAAGGDARGRQSAALLVVREGAGYGGYDDRYIDLRVEDHARPIEELARLLDIRHGELAAGDARRLLAAALRTDDVDRAATLSAALDRALASTRLHPGDGRAWMTLAEIHLAHGDDAAAAAAGIRAIREDPWIKAATLRGIGAPLRLVETLLQVEAFRAAWEALEIR